MLECTLINGEIAKTEILDTEKMRRILMLIIIRRVKISFGANKWVGGIKWLKENM